ncbi:MAG: O-methyltransferase [Mycobacteriales bacterium]
MSERHLPISDALAGYAVAHSEQPDELQRDLIARTRALPQHGMQIGSDQGALLTLLARATGARTAIEIGTFTGYSSLAIARGLPADGTLLCCDVSDEWTAIAREFWKRAGVDHKIELRLGPALDTLRALPAEPAYDFAFLDADKPGYPAYYEELVPRLNPNGLLLVDNTLQGGRITDPTDQSPGVAAVRAFNDTAAADPRVDTVLLAYADGLTLLRKR